MSVNLTLDAQGSGNNWESSLPYSGNPLDRAETLRWDADWIESLWTDSATQVLTFAHLRCRLVDAHIDWRPVGELREDAPWIFLGLCPESGRALLAADVTNPAISPDELGEEFFDVRKAAAILPHGESAIVAHGRSVLDWHARNRFCPKCGTLTEKRRGGQQRVCSAEACKAEHYPRVDPVVIMLVTRRDETGDYCLMGRQVEFPLGMMSALAGYIEAGESIEEAVRREIHEETGVVVGAVRYVMSQPWPFPSNLMIACIAEARTEVITIDPKELEQAHWFHREEVRRALNGDETVGFFVPNRVAVAHHLLRHWIES